MVYYWDSAQARREEMILRASNRYSLKRRERTPTDYEMISGQVSFYESVGSPELMPELSPVRVCFVCNHRWARHHIDGGCEETIYVPVDEDTRVAQPCGCRKESP